MSTIHVNRNHTLGKERAKKSIEEIAQEMKGRLGISYRWNGDELTFERSGVDGKIAVTDSNVDVVVKLGILASPMQGMVQREIEHYLDRHLG